MKKTSILLVACIISAGIYMAYAETDDSKERAERLEMMDKQQHEREIQERKEQEHLKMEERERVERREIEECESEQEIEIFDKNIRLDFQAAPLDRASCSMHKQLINKLLDCINGVLSARFLASFA